MNFMEENKSVIYLAGGCFWGMEKLMQSMPGVIDACSGYANGSGIEEAVYRTVCGGKTGFRETVRVEYDAEKVSLEALLLAYFYVIDPTLKNRQGNDIGTQYQTGIYYTDDRAKAVVEKIAATEKSGVKEFNVEIEPLRNFYPAEEYHQDYLDKNPDGYCHIPFREIQLFSKLIIEPDKYTKPAAELVKEMLVEERYKDFAHLIE